MEEQKPTNACLHCGATSDRVLLLQCEYKGKLQWVVSDASPSSSMGAIEILSCGWHWPMTGNKTALAIQGPKMFKGFSLRIPLIEKQY